MVAMVVVAVVGYRGLVVVVVVTVFGGVAFVIVLEGHALWQMYLLLECYTLVLHAGRE